MVLQLGSSAYEQNECAIELLSRITSVSGEFYRIIYDAMHASSVGPTFNNRINKYSMSASYIRMEYMDSR